MDNITISNRGLKRPAEPGDEPEVPAKPQIITEFKRMITLRISSIPIAITKDRLSKILECLAIPSTRTTEGKQYRGTNIMSISLAPAASCFDSDKYQVATVTFREIPPELSNRVSGTGTSNIWIEEAGGERFEVDVDSHFLGLTPLNNPTNPSVEYAVPLIPTSVPLPEGLI